MAYSSLHDLTNRFNVQLYNPSAQDKGLSREFTTEKINHAIRSADSIIDAYLAKRYQVPIKAPVPYLIKAISIDLAFVNLFHEHKPKFIGQLELFNLNILRQLQEGSLSFADVHEKDNVLFESRPSLFDSQNLKAF